MHVCDAYIEGRYGYGYFTTSTPELAEKFVERAKNNEILCEGRRVIADIIPMPKRDTHSGHAPLQNPHGTRVRVCNVNCVMGIKDFNQWIRTTVVSMKESPKQAISDIEIVFPKVQHGVTHCILCFSELKYAKYVIDSLNDKPFRKFNLKITAWDHPSLEKKRAALRKENKNKKHRRDNRRGDGGYNQQRQFGGRNQDHRNSGQSQQSQNRGNNIGNNNNGSNNQNRTHFNRDHSNKQKQQKQQKHHKNQKQGKFSKQQRQQSQAKAVAMPLKQTATQLKQQSQVPTGSSKNIWKQFTVQRKEQQQQQQHQQHFQQAQTQVQTQTQTQTQTQVLNEPERDDNVETVENVVDNNTTANLSPTRTSNEANNVAEQSTPQNNSQPS